MRTKSLRLSDVIVTWERGEGEPRSLSGETLATLIWLLERRIASGNRTIDPGSGVMPLEDPVLAVLSMALENPTVRGEARKVAARFAESCRVETNGA